MSFLLIFILSVSVSYAQPQPGFVHGPNFKLECNLCHGTDSWKVNPQTVIFDHNSTGFSLLGAHRQVDCQACHKSLVFAQIGHNCIDCHRDIHEGQLGIECEKCHSPKTWENRFEVFEQHQNTRFPLLGVHAVLDCQTCHQQANKLDFKMKGVECKDCHLAGFMKTLSPSHQKAGFNLNCENCHLVNATSWKQATYEHTPNFPLTGAHRQIECVDCHSDRFQGLAVECYSCHQAQYESTAKPDHQVFGFPTNCQECHSTDNWIRSQFDHLSASGFALEGVHGQPDRVQCVDCHVNNQINGLPRDCFGCHQKDFNGVKDPNHVAGNFPHDCLTCHNQQAWSPADFNHDRTNFPLTGAHQQVACEQCHTNSQYTGIPTDCYSCHQADFESTTDPNHQQSNFSHDCTTCHSTNAWKPATFDHAQTNFPLTGAHQNVQCNDCHTNGQYTGTPTDCYSCHQKDFDSTTDPNHRQSNFSHDCTTCHSTSAWKPATFDHSKTQFPLTGAHRNVQCIDCHSNGYANTPMTCISCHQQDYDNTTDPNHKSANFPNTCEDCHSTSAWKPANWDHDNQYFPIYSGKHRGEWKVCADCHVNSADYSQFECINCHEHNRTKMDDKHREVTNYVYDSKACYDCHPQGKGDD